MNLFRRTVDSKLLRVKLMIARILAAAERERADDAEAELRIAIGLFAGQKKSVRQASSVPGEGDLGHVNYPGEASHDMWSDAEDAQAEVNALYQKLTKLNNSSENDRIASLEEAVTDLEMELRASRAQTISLDKIIEGWKLENEELRDALKLEKRAVREMEDADDCWVPSNMLDDEVSDDLTVEAQADEIEDLYERITDLEGQIDNRDEQIIRIHREHLQATEKLIEDHHKTLRAETDAAFDRGREARGYADPANLIGELRAEADRAKKCIAEQREMYEDRIGRQVDTIESMRAELADKNQRLEDVLRPHLDVIEERNRTIKNLQAGTDGLQAALRERNQAIAALHAQTSKACETAYKNGQADERKQLQGTLDVQANTIRELLAKISGDEIFAGVGPGRS